MNNFDKLKFLKNMYFKFKQKSNFSYQQYIKHKKSSQKYLCKICKEGLSKSLSSDDFEVKFTYNYGDSNFLIILGKSLLLSDNTTADIIENWLVEFLKEFGTFPKIYKHEEYEEIYKDMYEPKDEEE